MRDATPRPGSGVIVRQLRTVAALFAAWLAFNLLQSAIARAGLRGARPDPAYLLGVDSVTALAWALATVAIARWHLRIRRSTSSLALITLLHLPGAILLLLADWGAVQLAVMLSHPGARLPFWPRLVWGADMVLVSYALIVAVTEGLAVHRAIGNSERRAARLQGLLGRARLDYLDAQLQPHFLFNALGAVAEHACTDPALAERILDQLATGLRGTALPRGNLVRLSEELDDLESYVAIQRMRFADWLTIGYRVAPGAGDVLVPRLALQPLVENAIRHGMTGRSSPGAIEISATIQGDSLFLRVSDNGVGLHPRPIDHHGYGIGLANVRQRLAVLYGDADRVTLRSNGSGGAVAELRIPIAATPGAPDPSAEEGEPAPAFRPMLPRALRQPVVIVPLAWALCGLMWTQQSVLYLATLHRTYEGGWSALARVDFALAAAWALLTPFVVAAARRLPIPGPRAPLRAALLVLLGVAATTLSVLVFRALTSRAQPLFSPAFSGAWSVGPVIALLLVAIGQRELLLRWLSRRDSDAAALAAELDQVKARAERMQTIQPMLLGSLATIAQTVRSDAAEADRQIARLGDYLRGALETVGAGSA